MNIYYNYLCDKNLSINTIRVYSIYVKLWIKYLKQNNIQDNINKHIFIKYINYCIANYQPRTVKLIYNAIISYLKCNHQFLLINELRDIRLPSIQSHLKTIINLNEFNLIKNNIVCLSLKEQRNWLIFCILFLTGIRVNEILQFNKHKINNNMIKIVGKGKKTRIIYLTDYLLKLINSFPYDNIAINISNNQKLCLKQINIIIKKIGLVYFHKEITPHSLRRSYATNLLKNNVNLEIVRKALGHNNINTTAMYLQYNDDEILEEVNKVFN